VIPVDLHTHAPLGWLLPDYHEGVRPGARVKLDFTFEDHWETLSPASDRMVVLDIARGGENQNDAIAAYAEAHPGRVVGFMSVDPMHPGALEEMARAHELGLRGLKLAPIYQGFHPLDGRAFGVFAKAAELRLPILIHQGTTFPRLAPLKVANPLLLEDVVLAFPQLPIVIAHMGHPWMAETIVLIRKHPNLYADISALHYRPWQFYNGLILALEYGVQDKLLFGSDWPFATPAETAAGLRSINRFTQGTALPRVPDDVIEDIIGRDSLVLLGLD
jgi:predicted TIM-barrel fold metal-dependent hydrolase